MRKLIAAAFLALAFGNAQGSSTKVADYSDFWWTASENGWGAHVTLQDDTVFLVLYVYDANHVARFFVASDMKLENAAAAEPVFRGALFRTMGTPSAGTYNPTSYAATAVGDATLRFTAIGSATLTYSVDGVTVTKAITRQAYRPIDLSGNYRGGTFVTTNGCTGGAGLGSISYAGSFSVAQSGTNVTIDTRFESSFAQGGHCVLRGTVVQTGSIGAITGGTYSCTYEVGPVGIAGTFEMTDIELGEHGWFGRYRGTENGPICTHNGRFGGVRLGYDGYPASAPSDPNPQPPGDMYGY
jgi:hypothetical protein